MSSPRVFMGNLPNKARDDDIEEFFRGYGQIIDIQRKEGYAIVVLSHPRDADEAISDLNGKTLLNNRINVEKTYGSKKRDRFESRRDRFESRHDKFDSRRDKFESRRPVHRNERNQVIRTSHRVFVRNLSSRVSWQDLKEYMSTVSQPTFADAHKKFKNEGMVEFSTYEDMDRAIAKLDGTELNGRVIRVVPDGRTMGDRRLSPDYNRCSNNRNRSTSPEPSRRGYARESRPSRRFRTKERSFRGNGKRPRSTSVPNNASRRRRRSQSKSQSRSSRSRSRSTSFQRPKSPLGSPIQSSRQSRSRSRSQSRPRSARSQSPSIQRPKSQSRSRSRSRSTSEHESKRAKH